MENLNAIKVAKVPNPEAKPLTQDSRNIPKMPRLYLELIENKDKIRQNLVNKEYDADDAASDITFFGGQKDERTHNAMSDIEEEDDSDAGSSEISSVASDNSSIRMTQKTEPRKASSDGSSSGGDDDDTADETDDDSDDGDQRPAHQSQPQPQTFQQEPQQSSKSQQYAKILNEALPPKLSDLERQGEIHNRQSTPDLDRMYATEDEEDEMKRELLFKFELLRKAYKTEVPEFNVHSDLKNMTRSYESTLRRVSLDSCVENYKQLLIGGFMVLEFVLGYLFKFDMQGFTQQQILNMNQYERLLIELGEQSYVPGGSQWPVEVRLLLMVLGNAAIFVIAKMIMKKTGSNIMSAMNSFTRPQPSPMNKRKMRGPSIQPDDIPDISTDEF
jgi:hypothetical protein